MQKSQRMPYPLRLSDELMDFVEKAVKQSGRSKNSVIKSCVQVAKENTETLFKKIGVENAGAAK